MAASLILTVQGDSLALNHREGRSFQDDGAICRTE